MQESAEKSDTKTSDNKRADNAHFYRDLTPFHSFVDEAFDTHFYVDLPDDWWLVVADITGSTKAVDSGKYAEVNYLGAACIVAVTNAVSEYELPTVFGGDGATLAVPDCAREATVAALLATKRWGEEAFGLELRVGAVPVREIRARGASILVARMEFSPGNAMAMFRGDGFDLADSVVKSGEFAIDTQPAASHQPDLESLSCRWSPMPSTNGAMLCLIIGARAHDTYGTDEIYRQVLERINGVVALNASESSPVKVANMRFKLRLEGMRKELKSLPGNVLLNGCKVLFIHLAALLVFGLNRRVGAFDPALYKEEMAINSDFRKVNGMLRLIIDCTSAQCDAVERELEALHQEGRIIFGAHRARHAIMTCVAPNIENHEHVHYIDGSEGGLWSAAKGLKAQLVTRPPS
ncbi:MAG: DUF3095 family protein [Gammaproteobacteria bacterium]|nr:DUF3095 family protein [Gammaproteobacteria bacterium]